MSIFSSIPLVSPKRNKFNLSFTNKLTCEMGQLVPICVQEVLPGDRFKIKSSQLIRFAPLIAPMMSEVNCYVHFFFVPHRLSWNGWEDFITGSINGHYDQSVVTPQYPELIIKRNQVSNGTTVDPLFAPKSLMDYLGFQTFNNDFDPSGTQQFDLSVDLLPFMAYYRIWYDYYRDENLQNPLEDGAVSKLTGTIPYSSSNTVVNQILSLHRRCWHKDYFTSALPWPQKGDDVLIPASGGDVSFSSGSVPLSLNQNSSGKPFVPVLPDSASRGGGTVTAQYPVGASEVDAYYQVSGGQINNLRLNAKSLAFDPSTLNNFISSGEATAGTIRELRRAMAAQKFLERRAVGGSRYIEQNLAFFGVRSSDARLQRAEFLGGSKQPIVISQVLQQSESTSTSPQANPAGTAYSVDGGFVFDKSFEEYGYIMGIMSIMPKADYIQGIPRKYLRREPTDFYWPQFAHIGEQPIEYQELYFNFAYANNNGTFGYTPRYSEYRHNRNEVHGDFRDSLKFWTLARDFSVQPQLNNAFVQCNPSTRVFAVQQSDYSHVWVECALDISALRPIPKYAEKL